jgi:hypothetical protein
LKAGVIAEVAEVAEVREIASELAPRIPQGSPQGETTSRSMPTGCVAH